NMIGGGEMIVAAASAACANSRTMAGSPPILDKGNATPSFIARSPTTLRHHPARSYTRTSRRPKLLSALLYLPWAARPHDIGGRSVLKLGYKASAEQFGPTELLQFSRLAEQSGFDSVFISDHFQPWKHRGGHAPFSLAWLGALGALTSRITIGTSVLTPTFRYHPAVVAQAFATLGVMFPDRIVLGVGTGESLNEVPSTGVVWPDFKERFARLREAVTLMRRLWTEERVTFEGQYYRTQDATIYDRPTTPVPICIAAAGALIAKARLHHGERWGGSVERGACGRLPPRASVAGESGSERGDAAPRAGGGDRDRCRRRHKRQFRASLAPGNRRRRNRRRGSARVDRSARTARPVRPKARGQ